MPGSVNSDAHKNYKLDPSVTDFFAFNQSMTLKLKGEMDQTTWKAGIPVFTKRLSQLKPGRHKVRVEMSYWIRANPDEIDKWKRYGWLQVKDELPRDNTFISEPIAVGEFDFVLEGSMEMKMEDPMPQRKTTLDPEVADSLEKQIFERMSKHGDWGARQPKTETVMLVRLTGNWEDSGIDHNYDCPQVRCRCPRLYGLPFEAAVYRSPLGQWPKEEPIAVFKLVANSYQRGVLPDKFGIGVVMGGNREVDLDSVPDHYWQAIRRCPPELRSGLV